MEIRKIFFQDYVQTSTPPSQPLGYLVHLSSVSDQSIQMLQTCCYNLAKELPRRCDREQPKFFDDKIKAFMHYREKHASIDQRANLGQAVKPKANTSKPPNQASLVNMSLNTTPTKAPKPAVKTKNNTSSGKHNLTPSPTSSKTAKRRKFKVEQHSVPSPTSPKADNQRNSKIEHKVTMIGPSPEGLYYISTLATEKLLAVGLNDLVVRRRSEKEREKGGKRDRFDLFDGPWRIVKFDKPEKTYGINHELKESETEE